MGIIVYKTLKKLAARTFNFATWDSAVCAPLICMTVWHQLIYTIDIENLWWINFAYFLNWSTLAKLMNSVSDCVLMCVTVPLYSSRCGL